MVLSSNITLKRTAHGPSLQGEFNRKGCVFACADLRSPVMLAVGLNGSLVMSSLFATSQDSKP